MLDVASHPISPNEPHLAPGYLLDGRYELVRAVAHGGMATVWLARVQGKLGFEKLYAVKTILPHLARDASFRTMFLDEARIASRIRHPNVAALDDLGEDQGTLYMVLEWLHGESLAHLYAAAKQRGRPIPIDVLLRIVADACSGLHAAHELRDESGAPLHVVHRDVSPQNVLVTTAGVTKVIDFGIAKARDRHSEQTRTGLLKGKVEYAAPEQVRMKPVDRRADIWALGTILYQFLAGRFPYEADGDLARLQAIAAAAPPPPLPPSVPAAVAEVVATALRGRRDERFATALDMQRAIEACISTPITAADVAACLHENLADRLETRRREMAEALAEADRRGSAPPRERLASLPELAPIEGGPAEPSPPDPATEASRVIEAEPPLRARHWVAMTVATLITLAVWAFLVVVLVGPAPRR